MNHAFAAHRTPRWIRRGLQLALITAPAALFAVHLSSCTLIGLGTGAVIDSQRKDRSPKAILKIHKGSSLTLRLKDGRSLNGYFDGRREMDPGEYARAWAAWRDTAPVLPALPSPGDSVRIVRMNGSVCSGRLAAYQIDAIQVTSAVENCLADIESLHELADHTGQPFDRELLRDATHGAEVPLSTLIRLRTGHETVEIPVNAVELVLGPAPKGGKIIGVLVGLSADVAIVAAAAVSMGSSGCSSGYY